ncbi:FeoB-associated Cys-rich membrane protein [Flavobacterium suaedae]|nr:FeoB-associated Cys-rich membrane protein [Flavobacterium suaedae]
MDFQSIITYVLLGLAVGFLIKKYFFKKKKKKNDCGNDDCGCH